MSARTAGSCCAPHFCFPDGDGYPFHLAEAPSGGLRLSDCGHTLMHISYEHDIDSFLSGTRGMLLERIVDESGIHRDDGVFSVDTSVDRLPEAIFRFGQALTRVYDLTLLSRSNVGSTFYDDLADCLSALVDEARMQRDYQPEVPTRMRTRWTTGSRERAGSRYSSTVCPTATRLG